MTAEQALLAKLDALGMTWEVHEHEAVFTVEASASLHDEIEGAHTKNLFLKDAAGQYWLVTAAHDRRVDLKALPAVIGSKKLSFAKAADMERLLGVSPGSVTPLAGMNDIEGAVKIVLDASLASAEIVNVHPLRNTATIGLSGENLILFLHHCDHDVLIAALPEPQ